MSGWNCWNRSSRKQGIPALAFFNVEMLKDLVGGDAKTRKKIEAIERNIDRASPIAKVLLHF